MLKFPLTRSFICEKLVHLPLCHQALLICRSYKFRHFSACPFNVCHFLTILFIFWLHNLLKKYNINCLRRKHKNIIIQISCSGKCMYSVLNETLSSVKAPANSADAFSLHYKSKRLFSSSSGKRTFPPLCLSNSFIQ